MKKKIVAIVLSALLVMSLGSVAYAADDTDTAVSEAPSDLLPGSGVYEVVEKDPVKLEQIAKDEGLVAPDGQKLVCVKTIYVNPVSEDEIKAVEPPSTKSVYITNVATVGYRYYSNDYDSYWYYGPYSLSATYGQTRYAGYSSSPSVSSSMVSAAVGFSVTSSYYRTGSHSAYVPSGQSLNLRVYMRYLVKSFDIYDSGVKIGSGSAWKPYSLLFREYWYA